MTKQSSLLLLPIFLVAVLNASDTYAQDRLISTAKIVDLAENIEDYIAVQGGAPIVVIVKKIPDPKITAEDISAMAKAITPTPRPDNSGSNVPASVVTVFEEQLECLTTRTNDVVNALTGADEMVDFATELKSICSE
ncbi:hypothetical protein WNY61_07800 [Sulfitobacter sp. AS92]|uniref:hypothetical protein n=1 Tax=Sulfitobacter sp. AS92 TaxID=3135783 RepID=UPI00317BA134